jgi:hypothetical protein
VDLDHPNLSGRWTNLHGPVLVYQHVWRLQIPMDNRRIQAVEIVDAFCLHCTYST